MIQVVEPSVSQIAANIRQQLDLRQWRISRLADELSDQVQRRTLYRIANGEVMPTVPSIAEIASVLGTTIDALISETD